MPASLAIARLVKGALALALAHVAWRSLKSGVEEAARKGARLASPTTGSWTFAPLPAGLGGRPHPQTHGPRVFGAVRLRPR